MGSEWLDKRAFIGGKRAQNVVEVSKKGFTPSPLGQKSRTNPLL